MEINLLKSNVNHSTRWSLIGQIVSKIASPIINMILARILMPEDFGVVATITIIMTFSFIFVDGGFSNYIIQHKFADKDDYEISLTTSFWSNLVMSIIFSGIIIACAGPLCNFLGSSGYEVALMISTIQIPLNALSSIFIAHMSKEFRFKQSSLITIISSMLPFVITIPLALVGFSYYSLIIGTIASYILKFILYLFLAGWKPSFKFSFAKLKTMFMFCFVLTLRQFFIYTSSYAGTFIISQFFGSYYLGLFKNATSTVTSIYSIFSAATFPVVLSGLSKTETDEVFYDIYFNYQRYLSYLIIPMCLGIIVFQKEITLIMFGSEWLAAAPIVGWYGLLNGISVITNNFASTAFVAKGKIYVSIIYQIVTTIINAVVYALFALLGESLFHYSFGIIAVAILIVSNIFMTVFLKANFVKQFSVFTKPLICTAIMSIYTIPTYFISDNIFSVVTIILFSMTLYFIFFYLLFKKDLKGVLETYIGKKIIKYI